VVQTENLTTLMVVVGKYSAAEFLARYEGMVPAQEGRPAFIVPRSARLVAEDNEYAVFSVVVFKRVADDFKQAARQGGYQVREVDLAAQTTARPEEVEALRTDADRKRASLEEWLRTAYSEAFSCLLHATTVRLYVESVLRYGVPPRFLASVIRPHPKCEQMVRKVLALTFGGADARYWTSSAEDARAGLSGDEVYPYVSLTLNVE
jgi:V-type H+-transporting ATPase subunit C